MSPVFVPHGLRGRAECGHGDRLEGLRQLRFEILSCLLSLSTPTIGRYDRWRIFNYEVVRSGGLDGLASFTLLSTER